MKNKNKSINKIFLFPLTLAVIFFASFIIILSPAGKKNIVNVVTPTPSPTVLESNIGKQIGYINKAYYKNKKTYIDIDYVEWVDDDSSPNGFTVRNNDSSFRSIEVANAVPIYLIDSDSQDQSYSEISFDDLIKVLKAKQNLFWITLNDNVQAIEIKEQYLP